jgi:hypothetical protein
MVSIATARAEPDCSLAESAGLALHASEAISIFDDQVSARVLAEGDVHRDALLTQDGHDRQHRAVALVLWVLHSSQHAEGIGWAVSKIDNTNLPYYVTAPE